MKRTLLIFSVIALSMTYWACKKTDSQLAGVTKVQDPFIREAVSYLKVNISNADFSKLDLNSIQLMKTDSITTGMMVYPKDKADHKSIILGKQADKYISNWVTFETKGTSNDGVINTESFDGTLKNEVTFLNGKAAKNIKTDHGVITTTLFKSPKNNDLDSYNNVSRGISMGVQAMEITDPSVTLPEIILYSNYNNNFVTFYSLFAAFNQNQSYYNSYSTTLPSQGSGGGPIINVEFDNSLNEIGINLKDFLKCFDNISSVGAKFSAKICVDVPVNSNPNGMLDFSLSPGHTFIELIKTNGSQSIKQEIGFYPDKSYKSMMFNSVASKVVDNGVLHHEYNASLIMPDINASQFLAILNNLYTGSQKQYQLKGFNCTQFVLDAVNSIRPNSIVAVPEMLVVGSFNGGLILNSPQGLYATLKNMENANNSESKNIETGIVKNASGSHGACK